MELRKVLRESWENALEKTRDLMEELEEFRSGAEEMLEGMKKDWELQEEERQ